MELFRSYSFECMELISLISVIRCCIIHEWFHWRRFFLSQLLWNHQHESTSSLSKITHLHKFSFQISYNLYSEQLPVYCLIIEELPQSAPHLLSAAQWPPSNSTESTSQQYCTPSRLEFPLVFPNFTKQGKIKIQKSIVRNNEFLISASKDTPAVFDAQHQQLTQGPPHEVMRRDFISYI